MFTENKFIHTSILLAIISVTSVYAATHYASPAGDATWDSSADINMPCSASTAMNNAQAGDTVYFRGGAYKAPVTPSSGYTPAFHPVNSGTDGNPITFKAYQGEWPFIDNTINQGSASTVASFGAYNNNHIVWDGFQTKAVPDAQNQAKGFVMYQSNNICLKNSIIEGCTSGSSNNNCVRLDYAENALIENNKLFNARSLIGIDVNSAAIMSYHAYNMVVRNNNIYDSSTAVYDKYDGQNNAYSHNHIWDCDYGFHLNVNGLTCSGTQVYQNIIRNISATWAIEIVGAGDNNGAAEGFKFFNNVIFNSQGISEDSPGVAGTEIYNNIIVQGNDGLRLYTGASAYVDNNGYFNIARWNIDSYAGAYYTDFSAWQSSVNVDIHSLNADPLFVNVGGSSVEDYKLLPGSPYTGAGRDNLDAGAYVTGNEIIGFMADHAPLPPKELIIR